MNKSVMDIVEEDFDLLMNVNCKSVLFGMQTVVPYLKARGHGQIINIGSMLGRVRSIYFFVLLCCVVFCFASLIYTMSSQIPYVSNKALYSATKHAVHSLTGTANMRVDLKNEGLKDIHVTLFSPAAVATEFGIHSIGGGADSRLMAGAQPVVEVADLIADAMEKPVADVYSPLECLPYVLQ